MVLGVDEFRVSRSGLKYTSIREGVYAEAFPLFLNWYPSTTDIYLPSDGPIAYASRAELGEATAKLMLRDDLSEEKVVLLTGPKTYTFAEIVKVVNKVLGKEILVHEISYEEYVARSVDGDEGAKPVQFFEKMKTLYEGVEKGDGKEVDPLMGELLGRTPKDGAEVVEELLRGNGGYTWHQNYLR